ncbi:putative tyrosinase-like protein tyr-3 [Trichinella papuae]|uniref:Putative tyrosinase-like protein tyr-3 n=1 Tax=Trichinella papuae TaxID=268474 RepID=A0A0V1MUL2_9BILA|nr:putative tyrosinase-like protein tyr-3 [Trichinella papuae]
MRFNHNLKFIMPICIIPYSPLSPDKYWKLTNPSQCGEITCEYPTFCAISKLDPNKFSCEFVDDSCLTTVTFSKFQDENRTVDNVIQKKEKNFTETEISSLSQQIATQKKNYTEEAIALEALQALIENNRTFLFENNFTQFETMDQCYDHFDACCEWALLGKCEQLPALIGIACPVSCGTCNCNKSDISTCTMEKTKCRNNSETFDYNGRTKKENNTLLIIESTSFDTENLTKISERNTTESVNAEREMNHDEVQLEEKLTEVISLSLANFSTNNDNNNNNNNTILISERERASEEKNSNHEISSDKISEEVISHLNKETSTNKTHKIYAFRNESLSIFGETIAPAKETLLLTTESSMLGNFFKKTQQCKDENSLCLLWAIIGECTKNPYWMKPNCQRSCNTCGMTLKDVNKELLSPSTRNIKHSLVSNKNCKNQHELCQFWASINECTNNPDFMLINCAASCKSCSKLKKQNYED